jgi:hypothetical protein
MRRRMPTRKRRPPRVPHPLEHHPSYRAVIAAATPIAALSSALAHGREANDLAAALAITCGDLASGFAAPPGSRERVRAQRRAWVGVRELDRAVQRVAEHRAVGPEMIARARRAVDRADVLVGALPGVMVS